MADNLDLAFSLQIQLEEAEYGLKNHSAPQLADWRTAMLEWTRFVQRRLKAVDSEIAAELSTKAEEAREISRRDHELAFEFSREEVRARELHRSDGLMALELAGESEETQFAILQNIHDGIAHDRRQAEPLGILQAPGAPGALRALQALHVPQPPQAPREPQAPTNQQPTTQSEKRAASDEPNGRPNKRPRMDPAVPQVPQVLHECVVCSENFLEVELLTGSCSHRYCRPCLERLLENSLADETLFPPVCCRRNLLAEDARAFISPEMWAIFEEKVIEHNDNSRTYCSDPACCSYIPPTQVRTQTATCTKCTQQTCILCKMIAHMGECPQPDEAVFTLAQDSGWQRCSNCGHLVELRSGCNHITCRCGFQYCYVCAMKWKQCGCDQWNEGRLLEGHNAGYLGEDIIVFHGPCDHPREFRKIRRGGECEECGEWMRAYILECRECGFRACRTCRAHLRRI